MANSKNARDKTENFGFIETITGTFSNLMKGHTNNKTPPQLRGVTANYKPPILAKSIGIRV